MEVKYVAEVFLNFNIFTQSNLIFTQIKYTQSIFNIFTHNIIKIIN